MIKKLSLAFKLAAPALFLTLSPAQAQDRRFVEITVTDNMPIASNFALAARILTPENADRCLSDFAAKGAPGQMPRGDDGAPDPVARAGRGNHMLCEDNANGVPASHRFFMPEGQPVFERFGSDGRPQDINGALYVEIADGSDQPVVMFMGGYATFDDNNEMQIRCIGGEECSLTQGEQADLLGVMRNLQSWARAHIPKTRTTQAAYLNAP